MTSEHIIKAMFDPNKRDEFDAHMRQQVSSQPLVDDAGNESGLTLADYQRLQDENRRLRAFVGKFAEWNWISTPMPFHHLLDWQEKAAALLASMKPAEE